MAVWSKAPPLTACCLSPLPGLEFRPGHARRLPVIWGKAAFFLLVTPVSSTTYNWLVTNYPQYGINMMKNEIIYSKHVKISLFKYIEDKSIFDEMCSKLPGHAQTSDVNRLVVPSACYSF